MVEKGSKIFIWKIELSKKLLKNFKKNQGHKSRRSDSKTTACLGSRDSILGTSASKFNFFENSENCNMVGDSGKIVGVIEEIEPKVTSRVRNLQKNCLKSIFRVVEKGSKFS